MTELFWGFIVIDSDLLAVLTLTMIVAAILSLAKPV
jgi:hypothetical protein